MLQFNNTPDKYEFIIARTGSVTPPVINSNSYEIDERTAKYVIAIHASQFV